MGVVIVEAEGAVLGVNVGWGVPLKPMGRPYPGDPMSATHSLHQRFLPCNLFSQQILFGHLSNETLFFRGTWRQRITHADGVRSVGKYHELRLSVFLFVCPRSERKQLELSTPESVEM